MKKCDLSRSPTPPLHTPLAARARPRSPNPDSAAAADRLAARVSPLRLPPTRGASGDRPALDLRPPGEPAWNRTEWEASLSSPPPLLSSSPLLLSSSPPAPLLRSWRRGGEEEGRGGEERGEERVAAGCTNGLGPSGIFSLNSSVARGPDPAFAAAAAQQARCDGRVAALLPALSVVLRSAGAAPRRPEKYFWVVLDLLLISTRLYGVRDAACPLSTRGGMRLVRLVREKGGGGGFPTRLSFPPPRARAANLSALGALANPAPPRSWGPCKPRTPPILEPLQTPHPPVPPSPLPVTFLCRRRARCCGRRAGSSRH